LYYGPISAPSQYLKSMYVRECVRSALIPSKRSFCALSCRCFSAGLESTNKFCGIVRLVRLRRPWLGIVRRPRRRKTRQRDDLHSHALDACPLDLCFDFQTLPSMSSVTQLLEQALPRQKIRKSQSGSTSRSFPPHLVRSLGQSKFARGWEDSELYL
jgi:hypothetical protein